MDSSLSGAFRLVRGIVCAVVWQIDVLKPSAELLDFKQY